jgi:hypothetical protein
VDEPGKPLSENQERSLEPVLTKIADAFAELGDMLSGMGYGLPAFELRRPDDVGGGTPCHLCDCPAFVTTSQQGTAPKCARRTCGHPFVSHDVI